MAKRRWPILLPSRISEYKAKRLAAVRKIGEGEAAIARRLTAAAVNRPLALLRHLLRLAHEEWEAIDNVPRIRLEKEPQGRLRWLTQEEIARLLEASAKSKNQELRDAVIVALNTGLRRGELLGLTWERVDLSRGVIRLELTKSSRRCEVPMNEPTKARSHMGAPQLNAERRSRSWSASSGVTQRSTTTPQGQATVSR